MNNDLKKALEQLIIDIQSAKDFAIEQAPDVIHEMVEYYIITGWIGTVVGLVATAATLWVSRFVWTTIEDPELRPLAVVPLLVGGALACSLYLEYTSTLIKASLTPKWFIVEKIGELL